MLKRLSVVLLVVLLSVSGAFAAKASKSSQVVATASGSLQLDQVTYSVGSSVPIAYSYAGLPVGNNNYLVLQTICSGAWNGVVFDTTTEFFQSTRIDFSSSSGSGVEIATIPTNYQGNGNCTASLYLLFTVGSTNYSKTLASATFSVAMP